jgi:hypothetical protein
MLLLRFAGCKIRIELFWGKSRLGHTGWERTDALISSIRHKAGNAGSGVTGHAEIGDALEVSYDDVV